ncbi:hypothetical protein LTR37_010645 [Vermiconidia calcicola]|uniref:Uncharacterized protein n=1 Tax=Vermiconidia calcicola TaxID=1690605 RepID=A0ACC3N4A0_9PEZI|nr:hypothetical protein LTR37_010645 [Vermiconidia calcicola]
MATGFLYQPLKADREEVRFLVFDKDVAGPDEHLICSVKHASMYEALLPDFYAVSYTWGDTTRRRTILIDGRHVSVPQDAEEALRRSLTHIFGGKSKRQDSLEPTTSGDSVKQEFKIWIDVVCINHSDVLEKTEQLPMMRRIYSGAQEVLIWLGPDDDMMAWDAIDSIDSVVEECKSETNDLVHLKNSMWSAEASKLYARFSTGALPASCNLPALRNFYSSPWFTRLWVIQEAVLAKRAICFRGSSSIPLHNVALAAQWIWHRGHGKLTPDESTNATHVIGIRNATEIWDCLETPYATPKLLSTMLAMAMEFETTNPLDKIYGLLGLLQPWFLRLDMYIVPDYSISRAELYTLATRAAIKDTGSLGVLGIAYRAIGSRPDDDGDDAAMPSWVPRYDWSLNFSSGSPYPIRGPLQGACNGSPLRMRDGAAFPNVLTVQGVLVDEIRHERSFALEAFRSGYKAAGAEIAKAWSLTSKPKPSQDAYGHALEMAFAMTLCTGQNAALQDVTHDQTFRRHYAAFCEACGDEATKRLRSKSLGALPNEVIGNAQEYLKAVRQGVSNRKYFITATGRLGMGPKELCRSDKVCLIPGSTVPVVLRKEGGFWKFLGDAYVHGLMDGKFFCELEAHGRLEEKMQWFHIG